MDTRFRPLTPDDIRAARTLLLAELGATPWRAAPLDALDEAARGATSAESAAESRGIVAESDGGVVGVILFGMYSGTQGTGRIRAIAVDRAVARFLPRAAERVESAASVGHRAGTEPGITVAAELLERAIDALRDDGARLVIAELPGDPTLAAMVEVLRQRGFSQEGEIADFYRDGVPMMILRRDVAP